MQKSKKKMLRSRHLWYNHFSVEPQKAKNVKK